MIGEVGQTSAGKGPDFECRLERGQPEENGIAVIEVFLETV